RSFYPIGSNKSTAKLDDEAAKNQRAIPPVTHIENHIKQNTIRITKKPDPAQFLASGKKLRGVVLSRNTHFRQQQRFRTSKKPSLSFSFSLGVLGVLAVW